MSPHSYATCTTCGVRPSSSRIHLFRTCTKSRKQLADEIMAEAFHRGMLILTCGYSTIRFCPPLVLTKSEADEALERFEATIQACI
ncbi:MAG: aminotransferase class III-fold pyridoxal phosphate-dependent enzyme [Chloroflexia bacterium]|nr:aminotransferase class III-fold pyridoxal phosphate-dependent enzyme [Chloroflexia bacterium]